MDMSELEIYFHQVRKDFPTLLNTIKGKNLVYLDSAATSLKPQSVINRISDYYTNETSNVHRGAHYLADQATAHFEESRSVIAKFIDASQAEEIIFTRGTTEGINFVSHSWLEPRLNANDIILVSEMEHHANIVPWQMLAKKLGASVVAVKVTDSGDLDHADYFNKINTGSVKFVALTACSNTLGSINNLKPLIKAAHAVGAKVLIDGAQIVSQQTVSVQDIECDFFVFSSHKMFGPTGFGVVFGRRELLEEMGPWQGGGSMISKVSFAETTYNDIPYRFEAGTPHIEGAIGTKAAIDYILKIGFEKIHQWEQALLEKATIGLKEIPGVQIIGQAAQKGPILSFTIKGAHHSDVGQIMDQMGVAVRAGHHCTQPLMDRLAIPGTVRASFSIYNNFEDVDCFLNAVKKAQGMLT